MRRASFFVFPFFSIFSSSHHFLNNNMFILFLFIFLFFLILIACFYFYRLEISLFRYLIAIEIIFSSFFFLFVISMDRHLVIDNLAFSLSLIILAACETVLLFTLLIFRTELIKLENKNLILASQKPVKIFIKDPLVVPKRVLYSSRNPRF